MNTEQTTLFGLSVNTFTMEGLADIFDVSVSAIYKWGSEGFPIKGSLKAQIRWVRENRPLSSDKTLADARRQKIEIETELRRLELLIRQGELIAKTEVSALFTDRISIIRSGLVNFHRVIESKMMGHDLSELGGIVKGEAINLLERYSRRSGPLLQEGKK